VVQGEHREGPLRFGVIGCGRISEKHLSALTSGLMASELVAVCDIDAQKAESKGRKYSVPWYTNYHEMLRAHPEIDVVNVLTPSGYHAEHVVDIAPYGKAIICEKPMALRVEDCDAMIAACRRYGSRLFVVKQNRFNPAIVAARKALDENRFGKLVLGSACVRWCRRQSYYDQADWRGTWALDGGVMSQQASHHLDLLQWFMGPVETVQCQISTRLVDIEAEDTAVAILRFASGALGSFEATVATRPEDVCGTLSILGEHGTVIVGGIAVNRIEYWKFDEPLPGDDSIVGACSQDVPSVYGHGHGPYLARTIEAIRTGTPGPVEAEEARKCVELLVALYESAALGGVPVAPGAPARHTPYGRRSSGGRATDRSVVSHAPSHRRQNGG